jgi:RNA polymerase sigma-70 factor (family 1)
MPSKPEIQLISKLREDDTQAFDTLFHLYSKRLYRFAFSILKNSEDSEGVVQEAFLRIWNNRKVIDPSKSFKSYLFAISHNLIIDQLRNRLKEREFLSHLEMHFDTGIHTVENEVDYNIIRAQVDQAVDELPEKRKQVYKLSRVEGMSHKEISEQLNISVKTVENQINLALKYLKDRLGAGALAVILCISLFA